jgi:glycerol uptake facilitator protein
VEASEAASYERGRAEHTDEVPERGPAAYVGEFIGTFLLVFAVTAVWSIFVVAPDQFNPNPYIDWTVIALVHVFVLFMLIQTLALVSGAHLNPAVTVALTALRQVRPADAGIYIVCQLAGGVLGALLTKALLKDEGRSIDYGATVVSERLNGSNWLGFLAEMIATFFLVWAIVGVAVNPTTGVFKDWGAFVIGATLGAMVLIFGPLTGASLNPARTFGPALVGERFEGFDTFFFVYTLGPVVGALLAAFAYWFLFVSRGKREAEGMAPVG